MGGDWRPGRSASSGRQHRNGRNEVEDRREAPVAAARGGPKEEHGPTRLSGSGTNSAAPPWRRIHVEVLGPFAPSDRHPQGWNAPRPGIVERGRASARGVGPKIMRPAQ